MGALRYVLSASLVVAPKLAMGVSVSAAGDGEGTSTKQAPATPSLQNADEAAEAHARELEQQIGALREKVDQTKERLKNWEGILLLGHGTSSARLELVHRNELANLFVLESVTYALDGARLFTKFDGDLATRSAFNVFNGALTPGQHAVRVTLTYRGRGFGPVSYPESFRVTLTSSYLFDAAGGKVTRIEIVGYDRGNVTTPFPERPAVRYDVSQSEERLK